MSSWNYLKIMPQLVTIVITTIIICTISFLYYRRVKKMTPDQDPTGLVLVVELIIKSVEKLVVDIFGPKYKNLTIYLLYLISYILISNWLSVLGFASQVSMYTVTLSMGLVTFIGIYIVGIKFQKLLFFKKYIVNPLELITQFAPLISLSFRLFGNIMGGSIIVEMLYFVTSKVWTNVPIFGQLNLLVGVLGPVLHTYFDIFDGSIQALIFGILTIVYWKLQMEGEHSSPKEVRLTRSEKKKVNKSYSETLDLSLELNQREISKRV